MKKSFLIMLCIFTVFNYNGFAQESKLNLLGNLYSEQRLRTENSNFSWSENRLNLKLEKSTDNFKFYSNVWFRNITLPVYGNLKQLYDKNTLYPYNLQLREAYIEIYDFVFKNLDVKLGKQRIAWGKADRLNPTDNLNPYDLEDIWDFGRHNGSNAIRATYSLHDFSFEGVYVPYFRPANLPLGDWSSAFTSIFDLPQGLSQNKFTINTKQPKFDIKESSVAGIKANALLGGFDFSLSYVYGRDGLGMPYSALITPVDTQIVGGYPLVNVDISSQLYFPRYNIFGFDVAGNIGPFGIWGEAALFSPTEESVLTTDLSLLYPLSPVPIISDSVILKNEPFVKYVIGTDCMFGNGFYFNFQYLHGFLHERGSDALNDYLLLQFEKSLFEEKMKIIPFSGGYIVSDWDDVSNNYSLIYSPEIRYFPNDNTELSLSYRLLEGKGNNMFAQLKDKDEIIFKLKFSF